jgi:hypothetical protein
MIRASVCEARGREEERLEVTRANLYLLLL